MSQLKRFKRRAYLHTFLSHYEESIHKCFYKFVWITIERPQKAVGTFILTKLNPRSNPGSKRHKSNYFYTALKLLKLEPVTPGLLFIFFSKVFKDNQQPFYPTYHSSLSELGQQTSSLP